MLNFATLSQPMSEGMHHLPFFHLSSLLVHLLWFVYLGGQSNQNNAALHFCSIFTHFNPPSPRYSCSAQKKEEENESLEQNKRWRSNRSIVVEARLFSRLRGSSFELPLFPCMPHYSPPPPPPPPLPSPIAATQTLSDTHIPFSLPFFCFKPSCHR